MNRPPTTLHYRPDIDGLRALAVLSVLVFHLEPTWLPGGFLGVDVFFVISGYLITSIIHTEQEAGKFSIVRFYERRIRRIMPAMFVLFGVVTAYATFRLMPEDLLAYGKALKSAVLSISNFHFRRTLEDYFAADAANVPLLHTWSLGVEEQYYLVFPLLLAALHKWFKSPHFVPVISGIFVLSLGACAWVGQSDSTLTFFLLPFRAWELMLGSILAVARLPSPGPMLARGVGVLGLALILISLFVVHEENFAGGVLALPAVVGASLLIYAGSERNIATRLLSLKPMVNVGLISYSLYLWHWPLTVFGKSSGLATIWIFLLSIACGALSWRFVEQPFRKPGLTRKRWVFALWVLCTAAFLVAAVVIKESRGFPERFSEKVRYYLSFKDEPFAYLTNIKKHFDPSLAPTLGATNLTPTMAVWGDSHANAIASELDLIAKERHVAAKIFTLPAQPPIPGVALGSKANGQERLDYTAKTLELLESDPQIKTVIMVARWSFYNRGANEPGRKRKPDFYGHKFHSLDELDAFYGEHIKMTIDRLLKAGKHVVLIYPIPEAGINVPDLLANYESKGLAIPSTIDCPDFEERQAFVTGLFDSLGDKPNLVRLRVSDRFYANGKLTILEDNQPLYRDDDHLSSAGNQRIHDLLEEAFP